ncbi:MAG: choice-of-anchor tandem repeat NxxGxxAF-containing protein [Chloroflexota bacterium]
MVAFQATSRDGSSGVYSGSGGPVSTVADSASGLLTSVISHPDINALGIVTAYATLGSGGRGVVRVHDGQITVAAMDAGPLGPTINDAGTVAFRTDDAGPTGIFVVDDEVRSVAESGLVFRRFHGLPVINHSGLVVFRADRAAGGEGVYVGDGGPPIPIVETGNLFTGFGDFPTLIDDGTVAFSARLRSGGSGVFVAAESSVKTVIDTSGAFESFRGVLLDATSGVIFHGTPKGGRLGVFSGPEPERDRLIGLGEPFDGSTIVDFALNPVSMNGVGQVALRVRLEDDRQLILRADRST